MTIKSVIAMIVISAIVSLGVNYVRTSPALLGSATDCGSNTCLTSLYDSGTLAVGGATTLAGTLTTSGAITAATSTMSGSLVFSGVAPSCIQFYATSTNTAVKIVFDTNSTTTPVSTAGILGFTYGRCTN